MTITIDTHSGFCFGVTSAILKAEEELGKGPLYCLGDIVHNSEEVTRLEQMGLQTIDHSRLGQLTSGRVLLRAHGEPPSTYETANQQSLEIIDATCPVVKKLQERIRATYIAHPQAQILIFGKAGHAEVVGLQGQTDDTAIVVEGEQDLDKIDYTKDLYLFSQTTMSIADFQHMVDCIRSRALVQFEFHDTICRNVANRVEQLREFAKQQDYVLFVGGQKSSNAKVLFSCCAQANDRTIFVSSPDEITSNILPQGDWRVGICGATSTPLWLMETVAQKLKDCYSV